jgi:hypothetical protein
MEICTFCACADSFKCMLPVYYRQKKIKISLLLWTYLLIYSVLYYINIVAKDAKEFFFHLSFSVIGKFSSSGAHELIPILAGRNDNPICRTGRPGYIGYLHKRLQIRAQSSPLLFRVLMDQPMDSREIWPIGTDGCNRTGLDECMYTVQCNRSSKQHCEKLPHLLTSCASDLDIDGSLEQSNYSKQYDWTHLMHLSVFFMSFDAKQPTFFFGVWVFIFYLYILYKNIVTEVNILCFRGWTNK